MMEELWFPEYLREFNMTSILLRFALCIVCGGAMGIEREWKHRTAGFKTHIIVCMGAAICMMTGYHFLRDRMKTWSRPVVQSVG